MLFKVFFTRLFSAIISLLLVFVLNKVTTIDVADRVFIWIGEITLFSTIFSFGLDKLLWSDNLNEDNNSNAITGIFTIVGVSTFLFSVLLRFLEIIETDYLILLSSLFFSIISFRSWEFQSSGKVLISTFLQTAVLPFSFLLSVILFRTANHIVQCSTLVLILALILIKFKPSRPYFQKLFFSKSILLRSLFILLPGFIVQFINLKALLWLKNSGTGFVLEYSSFLRVGSVVTILAFVLNRTFMNSLTKSKKSLKSGLVFLLSVSIILYLLAFLLKDYFTLFFDENVNFTKFSFFLVLLHISFNYSVTQYAHILQLRKKEHLIIIINLICMFIFILFSYIFSNLNVLNIVTLILLLTLIKNVYYFFISKKLEKGKINSLL